MKRQLLNIWVDTARSSVSSNTFIGLGLPVMYRILGEVCFLQEEQGKHLMTMSIAQSLPLFADR